MPCVDVGECLGVRVGLCGEFEFGTFVWGVLGAFFGQLYVGMAIHTCAHAHMSASAHLCAFECGRCHPCAAPQGLAPFWHQQMAAETCPMLSCRSLVLLNMDAMRHSLLSQDATHVLYIVVCGHDQSCAYIIRDGFAVKCHTPLPCHKLF